MEGVFDARIGRACGSKHFAQGRLCAVYKSHELLGWWHGLSPPLLWKETRAGEGLECAPEAETWGKTLRLKPLLPGCVLS